MCLVFDCRWWFLLFHLLLSIHRHIRTPTCFVKLSSLLVFKSSLSSPHDILIVYSFQGTKRKKLRDLMSVYLPCKCKHLCMLKFRAVSPTLTKDSTACTIILLIAGFIINLIIWLQWCKERFIVHFMFQ